MRFLFLLSILAFSVNVQCDVEIADISPRSCVPGVHEQPDGIFALFVFCDDALGTNVALFQSKLGAPKNESYSLVERFWQGQEWASDVISYAWLPSGSLLMSTSGVYGSGSVYKIDPSAKESIRLLKVGAAAIEIVSVNQQDVIVRYETKPGVFEEITVGM